MGSSGLVCQGLSKSFGGTVAVNRVDIELRPGELVALVGENGAGKSTLSKILSGIVRPDAGTMAIDDHPYEPQSPRDALDADLATIHQELQLLPELSIAENLFVGRYPTKSGAVNRAQMRAAAGFQLRRLGLDINPDISVGRLSIAGQQLVEIAKALVRDARFLILDEPTAPLGGAEVDELFRCVRSLKSEGVGILYVTHRLEELREIADRIVVMRDGAVVTRWERGDVPTDQIVGAMVGRDVNQLFPEPSPMGAEVLLRVRGLTRKPDFENVSFELRAGEVLGIAGLVGAGRTELVRAIFGADRVDSGSVELNGVPVGRRGTGWSVRHGMAFIPEDRKGQGVILPFAVEENLALPSLRRLGRRGVVTKNARRRLAQEVISQLRVKATMDMPTQDLSGGNQQKVVIGKWLWRRPKVVIFDEPTRGVDVGARPAIYDVIANLTGEGAGAIVVSSELEEVLGLAHRVLVMSRGRMVGVLARSEATPERVMTLASTVASVQTIEQ